MCMSEKCVCVHYRVRTSETEGGDGLNIQKWKNNQYNHLAFLTVNINDTHTQ